MPGRSFSGRCRSASYVLKGDDDRRKVATSRATDATPATLYRIPSSGERDAGLLEPTKQGRPVDAQGSSNPVRAPTVGLAGEEQSGAIPHRHFVIKWGVPRTSSVRRTQVDCFCDGAGG